MKQTQSDKNLNSTSGKSANPFPDPPPQAGDNRHQASDLKNSNTDQAPNEDPKTIPGSSHQQTKGIAALFEKEEIKHLFRSYLVAMFIIEGFIFFVSFLSQIGPETVPFPWKPYFFAAFTVPVTITFLLGIIVLSFDRYIFGQQNLSNELNNLFQSAAETRSRIHKLHASLYVLRQFPFLLGLLTLLVLSVVSYKLNDILAVVGRVGERTAHYLFIGLAVALVVAVVVGLIWMFLSYNLRKKTLEYQFQYKKDVIDKTGLILIGEDRVMNQEGRILSFNNIQELTGKSRPEKDPKTMIIDQS